MFADAAAALKEEYRHGSQILRLLARKVEPVRGESGDIFRVEVAGFNAMHWGWEGASAWRSRGLLGNGSPDGVDDEEELLWKGEVLEVDEDKGCLFISTGSPGMAPSTGYFLVKPFDFLEQLYRLYHDDRFGGLRERLARHLEWALKPPSAASPGSPGVEPGIVGEGLAALSRYPWTVLWGPPGTGKTFSVGWQVAEAFLAGRERILVLSTTNRATDEVAISIGKAVRRLDRAATIRERIVRVGSGADFHRYANASLQDLLIGGETELRRRLSRLLQERHRTEDPAVRAGIIQQINQLRRMIKENTQRVIMAKSRDSILISMVG